MNLYQYAFVTLSLGIATATSGHLNAQPGVTPKQRKGLPGPGLLAFVTVSKQGDHLPLYRQEEIFGRHGVDLSRSMLCGWLAECALLLQRTYGLFGVARPESGINRPKLAGSTFRQKTTHPC